MKISILISFILNYPRWLVETSVMNRLCRRSMCQLNSQYAAASNVVSIVSVYQEKEETKEQVMGWLKSFERSMGYIGSQKYMENTELERWIYSLQTILPEKRSFSLTLMKLNTEQENTNNLIVNMISTGANGYYIVEKNESWCRIIHFYDPGHRKDHEAEIDEVDIENKKHHFSYQTSQNLYVVLANPAVMRFTSPKVVRAYCEQSSTSSQLRNKIFLTACYTYLRKIKYPGSAIDGCKKYRFRSNDPHDILLTVVFLRIMAQNERVPLHSREMDSIVFVDPSKSRESKNGSSVSSSQSSGKSYQFSGIKFPKIKPLMDFRPELSYQEQNSNQNRFHQNTSNFVYSSEIFPYEYFSYFPSFPLLPINAKQFHVNSYN